MPTPIAPVAPVSWGELLDKMTILEIKCQRITAAPARANVTREYAALREVGTAVLQEGEVAGLFHSLLRVNAELWDIEDDIRAKEALAQFGDDFIQLARSVYQKNDERAAIKRRINQALRSELVEEKSYWSD